MRIAFGIFLLVVIAGCGSGKRAIEGTVSLDGAPLDQGSITFAKSDAREGAMIKDGKFRVELRDGAYTVEIHGFKVIGKSKKKYMNEWTEFEDRKDIKSEQKVEVGPSTLKFEFAIHDKK